jgi:hypothetical protein
MSPAARHETVAASRPRIIEVTAARESFSQIAHVVIGTKLKHLPLSKARWTGRQIPAPGKLRPRCTTGAFSSLPISDLRLLPPTGAGGKASSEPFPLSPKAQPSARWGSNTKRRCRTSQAADGPSQEAGLPTDWRYVPYRWGTRSSNGTTYHSSIRNMAVRAAIQAAAMVDSKARAVAT